MIATYNYKFIDDFTIVDWISMLGELRKVIESLAMWYPGCKYHQ